MTLEVRVDAATTNGLEIIEHLPATRPCRLEGRNGIGKSTLIRLLALASGEQPYGADSRAWRSLKQSLGETAITIFGLEDAPAAATLRFTPEQWPDTPNAEIGDWIGQLTIGDTSYPVAELQQLLEVVHLSGTEGLHHTLTQKFPQLANSLLEVSEALDAIEDDRASLGELVDELIEASPVRAKSDSDASAKAVREQTLVAEDRERKQSQVEDLGKASALRAILAAGDAEEHEREILALRTSLEAARMRLAQAESEHDRAVAKLAKGNAAQRRAGTLEAKLRATAKTQDDLLTRQLLLSGELTRLGIEPDVRSLSDEQLRRVVAARDEAEEKVRILRRESAWQSRTNAENELLDDIRSVLEGASARGLGSLLLATIDGASVTVDGLLTVLGEPTESQGAFNDAAVVAAEVQAGTWNEILSLFDRRIELERQSLEINRDLEALRPTISEHGELGAIAADARAELDRSNSEVRSLNTQIGALNRSGLGPADADEAESQIRDLLKKHTVSSEDLDDALAVARRELSAIELRDATLNDELDSLRARAAKRRVLRDKLRRRARSDPAARWMAVFMGQGSPSANSVEEHGEPDDLPDESWQVLTDFAVSTRNSLTKLANDMRGLAAVADGAGQSGPYAAAVNSVIEAEARADLSNPAIADALFDGGTVQRVNLDERTIAWTLPDGQHRSRPLSTFSSGQQALGYIRARLQQVAERPSRNRIVFLDEFGAFIAADRRRPLAELLTSSDLTSLANEVVVVLPLQADYAAELDQTTGSLHETFAKRAYAIESVGYFTEEFIG